MRLRFYWETKDEDDDPYALTDDIKEWLLENFNYDIDRIVGAWRTPISREKWQKKQPERENLPGDFYADTRQVILKLKPWN